MFRKIYFTIFISTLSLFAYSQSITISGKVTDNSEKPLEYASVSVQDPVSFSELFAGVTDVNGNFSIEISKGEYLLYIESFSGSTFEKQINVTNSQDLGIFKLGEAEVVALNDVTITSSNQAYKIDLDKKVYSLENDPMSKGSSLSDALQNVPSLQVDADGNISLRGNENVRILIDGKPSALIGISDPAQALQSLPADAVERIEVVTNPSARYEAEGSGGIINIILKKGKLKGWNGSVNLTGGIPETIGAGLNLNYRTNKWNIFTNLNYRYAERIRRNSSYTTRFDSIGTARYEDMNSEATRVNNGYTIVLGTEYYLDDRNTFTVSGNYSGGDNKNSSDLTYVDFDQNLIQTASSVRTERENEDDSSAEGNFNFKHEFDEPGHQFTVDARASYQEESEMGDLREIGTMVNSTERSTSSERQNRILLMADYVYPFKEKGKLELGARGEMEGTLSDFGVDTLTLDGWESKPEFSNKTDYQQNIYAAYVQYGNSIGKFSYFAGLRMENSDITINSILNENIQRKNYVDFFPSLFLTYELKNEDQLQLSYSRRIRRPRGRDLIPFTSYSNNRNLFLGNPDLNPQYTDSYELSYIAKFGPFMVTPNAYFSHTQDNIQRYQSIDENDALVTRPINVGTEDRYGGDITFTVKPWKWWNVMGNLNLFGYKTIGEFTETRTLSTGETLTTTTTNFDGEGFSWFGRINSTFSLPKKFNIQITGDYRGAQKTAQTERKPMYGVDLGITKDLFKDKATITLSVRDLFNSRAWEFSSFGDDFYLESRNRWNVRSVNLTFTYRFNQSKLDQKKQERNDTGMDEDMGGTGDM